MLKRSCRLRQAEHSHPGFAVALILVWCAPLFGSPKHVNAQANCTADAMIVFDGSGSMSEMGFNQLDEPRIFDARRAVRAAIPEIALYRRLGLIIYGPGADDVCYNIDLRFKPVENAAPLIISEIETLTPAGGTPLTASVREAARVLNYRNKPGVVVLITDGRETCFGEPCLLGPELAAEARDLTVHIIGFRVRSDHFSWSGHDQNDDTNAPSAAHCLAEATGGRYFSTETIEELITALRESLGCPPTG